MKNFIIWTLHKYIWDDEIKKDDMGRASSTHRRHDNWIWNCLEKLKGRKCLEDVRTEIWY